MAARHAVPTRARSAVATPVCHPLTGYPAVSNGIAVWEYSYSSACSPSGFFHPRTSPVDWGVYAAAAGDVVNGVAVGPPASRGCAAIPIPANHPVTLVFTLTNISGQAIGLVSKDDPWHANTVRIRASSTSTACANESGSTVWTQHLSLPGQNANQPTVTAPAGGSITETVVWNEDTSSGQPVPTGPAHSYWVDAPGFAVTYAGATAGDEYGVGAYSVLLVIE